jgi:hypothetical protein
MGVGFLLLPWCSSPPSSGETEHQAEVAPTGDEEDDHEDLTRVSMYFSFLSGVPRYEGFGCKSAVPIKSYPFLKKKIYTKLWPEVH